MKPKKEEKGSERSNSHRSQGIITGCDQSQEWMLKWWLEHAEKNAGMPLSFVDFGLSKSACIYLKNRGINVLDGSSILKPFLTKSHYSYPSSWIEKWKRESTSQRPFYFAKPLACLLSPYDQTLWVDLDCKIVQTPKQAFSYIDPNFGMTMSLDSEQTAINWQEQGLIDKGSVAYQAGVIAFNKDSSLMLTWKQLCLSSYDTEYSEQTAIINYLHRNKKTLQLLPSFFNHLNPHQHQKVSIAHYGGHWHKLYLIRELNFV